MRTLEYTDAGGTRESENLGATESGRHGMVEALMFQQAIPPIYSLVYPEPGKVAPKVKKDLNSFLSFWLRNLKEQGHRLTDDD